MRPRIAGHAARIAPGRRADRRAGRLHGHAALAAGRTHAPARGAAVPDAGGRRRGRTHGIGVFPVLRLQPGMGGAARGGGRAGAAGLHRPAVAGARGHGGCARCRCAQPDGRALPGPQPLSERPGRARRLPRPGRTVGSPVRGALARGAGGLAQRVWRRVFLLRHGPPRLRAGRAGSGGQPAARTSHGGAYRPLAQTGGRPRGGGHRRLSHQRADRTA